MNKIKIDEKIPMKGQTRGKDGVAESVAQRPEENIHFRVTLFNEWNPNWTISVWAPDKDTAKNIAEQKNLGWDAIRATVSKDQTSLADES